MADFCSFCYYGYGSEPTDEYVELTLVESY